MNSSTDHLAAAIQELAILDDAGTNNGISHHFIQLKMSEDHNEFRIGGNYFGLVNLALNILKIAESKIVGQHFHFDEAGIVDRCDVPLVVSYDEADWESK